MHPWLLTTYKASFLQLTRDELEAFEARSDPSGAAALEMCRIFWLEADSDGSLGFSSSLHQCVFR